MADYLNVVVVDKTRWADVEALFPADEEIMFISSGSADMLDLLLYAGCFPSKSQARKNWRGSPAIPEGWSEHWVGKKRRQICIWNPSE